MKKEIIAAYKKPNYANIITLFCVVVSIMALLLGVFITKSNIVAVIICLILLCCAILFFVFKIINIKKLRKRDNTLIYFSGKTFYFPLLNMKINKAEINRVVFDMRRYSFVPLNGVWVPVENKIGKLHITYFDGNEEYYIVLKHVIYPDIAEKRIKEICGI